jgi:enoyl-CoA hydratase/carnithine racemase
MPDTLTPPAVFTTEDRGAVRILWLDRPGKLNALDTALTRALHDALVAGDQDEGVRALVLAGRGRAFCAGADLSEFRDLTPRNQRLVLDRADLTTRTQMLLQRTRKPIVSAVQGAALGGGAGLAIGCDMMVAATDLKFGYPEMRHSIVPAIVMTGLQRQVGRKVAFELVSLGAAWALPRFRRWASPTASSSRPPCWTRRLRSRRPGPRRTRPRWPRRRACSTASPTCPTRPRWRPGGT